MRILMITLSVLLLQGCFFQHVNAVDIKLAYKLCKEKGQKFIGINEYWEGSTDVFCKGEHLKSHSLENYKITLAERVVEDE